MSEKKLTEMTAKELREQIDKQYDISLKSTFTVQLVVLSIMLLIRTVEETS